MIGVEAVTLLERKDDKNDFHELKVLVIDEDEENLTEIDTCLVDEKFLVRYVDDATNALEEIGDFEPDIIIIELQQGNDVGFEVCQLVKSEPRFAEIHIIFTTADQDLVVSAFDAGANEF